MKSLVLAVLCFVSISAGAADKFKFSFNNEELGKVIETYAKETGQKFVVDPGVRGRVTILLPEAVSADEAFNQLSSALAVNGFAISKRDDTMVIMSARNVQRNFIETFTDKLPSLKPERMVTYIATLKSIPAMNINRDLRIIPSRDGEMSVYMPQNQLIITDWTSNIHRIADLLKEVDKPTSPEAAKMIAESKKHMEKARAEKEKRKE